MTVAHPGADHCALCMLKGVLTPAMKLWPGAPLCGDHIAQCGGTVEYPPDTVVDFRLARARLRPLDPISALS
jgi:hypothetical protein